MPVSSNSARDYRILTARSDKIDLGAKSGFRLYFTFVAESSTGGSTISDNDQKISPTSMVSEIYNDEAIFGSAACWSTPRYSRSSANSTLVRPATFCLPRNCLRIVFLILCLLNSATIEGAEEASEWLPPKDTSATRITRVEIPGKSPTAQTFRIDNAGIQESLVFRSPQAPSRLHNDFEAAITVIASSAGARPGLIVLLPEQIDPRTGQALQMIIRGETLKDADKEKKLVVRATKQAIDAQLRSVRAELHQADIRFSGAIVIGLAVLLDALPGENFIRIGDVAYGPIIPPDTATVLLAENAFSEMKSTTLTSRSFTSLDISLDSIQINHEPTILRMAPDHGEAVETLKQLGLNTVWGPDFRETERARELFEHGFAVLATPPHPEFEPGDYSKLLQALPPLEQQCPSVSGWYLGTRVSHEDMMHLLAWSREVRSGDRTFQRLQLADLTEAEGAAAREIDLIGIGRHVVGRSDSFGELRNLLFRRRLAGGQLAFPWTWIQVEPSSTQQAWRSAMQLKQPYVEPEQIQHQVYAAISSGCKGIGFWKTAELRPENPQEQETAIAIELACLEIELLESLLARGRLDGHLSLKSASEKLAADVSGAGRRRPSGIQSALGGGTMSASAGSLDMPAGSDAAVITADRAMLILPILWDESSQIVPAPMFERSVELTVAATETASAYRVTTTGIHNLPRNVIAGGLHVKIDHFDRSAAIVVSSDTELIAELRNRIYSMAERAATQSTKLADLKYVRVMQVVETLRDEHRVPQGADALLATARQALKRAEHEVSSADFDEAAVLSRDCLQILRQVQQACWNDAVAELSAPAESPHTMSFSTLPDHWRLMHYIDRQIDRVSGNLLPSGDFENVRMFSEDDWQRDSVSDSPYGSTAGLVAEPARGNTFLQLKAWQTRPGPTPEITPLALSTPKIATEPGDVMLIRVRLRNGRIAAGVSSHPVLVFDSELGPENGMRPKLTKEWQTFELVRPIAAASEFRVSFALTGQTEIHLDDLQIRKLPPIEDRSSLQLIGNEEVEFP